ncbi:MAG: alpha/beta fold hydrolase [Firmicutes bacterium]|nr:alpha/beta fold hydrolase [Bacillota bacterium]
MKKKIPAGILISAALLTGPALAFREYRRNFHVRMADPTGFTDHYFETHPELRHEEFSVASSLGPKIRGFVFDPEAEPKALIVMTHGYNLSMENYLPLVHLFTRAGFKVLFFDGIGVGISEGQAIYGLPQHINDMKSVLDAVSEDPEMNSLPLLLFGHSWGGYAACCVPCLKDYPIRGILTCAAFRKSSSSMIPTINKRYPKAAPFLVAFAEAMERMFFGRTAALTSTEGLARVDCPARLYHSADDAIVSFEESFLKVKEALSDRENLSFVSLEGRNHNLYLPPANDRQQRRIRKLLRADLSESFRQELNAELWYLMSRTDEDMAEEFIEFFNNCLQGDNL